MRITLWLFLCLLTLAGCERRSTNPLLWKLECDSPEELQEWMDDNLPLLTSKLQNELAVSIGNIKAKTYDPDPVKRANLLCRKLDGRTVREVLVAGMQISRDQAIARVQRESGNLVQLVNMSNDLSAAEYEQLQARVTAAKKYLEQLQAQLAQIDARLTELAWPHAG